MNDRPIATDAGTLGDTIEAKARQPTDIEMARARAIVGAMTALHLEGLGLPVKGDAALLATLSLRDLLVANEVVRDHGAVTNADGSRNVQTVCDDRLIAAIYALLHYPAHREPMQDHRGRADAQSSTGESATAEDAAPIEES